MSVEHAPRAWPTDLVFDRETKALTIAFDDGEMFEVPFELLRIESPSAENKGHGGNVPPPVTGKANVNVTSADPSAATLCASSSTTATIPASSRGIFFTISAATKSKNCASIAIRWRSAVSETRPKVFP